MNNLSDLTKLHLKYTDLLNECKDFKEKLYDWAVTRKNKSLVRENALSLEKKLNSQISKRNGHLKELERIKTLVANGERNPNLVDKINLQITSIMELKPQIEALQEESIFFNEIKEKSEKFYPNKEWSDSRIHDNIRIDLHEYEGELTVEMIEQAAFYEWANTPIIIEDENGKRTPKQVGTGKHKVTADNFYEYILTPIYKELEYTSKEINKLYEEERLALKQIPSIEIPEEAIDFDAELAAVTASLSQFFEKKKKESLTEILIEQGN